MYKAAAYPGKPVANPSRERKIEDKFFFCLECKRAYEQWKKLGAIRQEYLDNFPTIGLTRKECEECKSNRTAIDKQNME